VGEDMMAMDERELALENGGRLEKLLSEFTETDFSNTRFENILDRSQNTMKIGNNEPILREP